MGRHLIDLTGKQFGKLTVISRDANDRAGNARWLCQCECGKQKTILVSSLVSGRTKSCGCQAKFKDLTGQTFGRLTVLSRAANRQNRNILWLCQCECGKQKTIIGSSLVSGRTKSCGCLTQFRDLTGQKFGRLTVLSRADNDQNGNTRWLCQCDCGKQKTILGSSLVSGHTKSCGCSQHSRIAQDLTGQKFGRLTVLSRADNKQNGSTRWLCQCECGKQKTILGSSLVSGHTKSCGCSQHSRIAQDLTGQKFGRLTVLSRADNEQNGNTRWLCQCDCGKQKTVLGSMLVSGHTKSCGCNQHSRIAQDLTGQKFGRLTVLSRADNDQNGNTRWLCQCDCGKQKTVLGSSLVSGHTKSCGCNQHSRIAQDLTGQKFGRLTVLSQADNQNGRSRWLCQCECGKQKTILTSSLISGNTKSCGCQSKTHRKDLTGQKFGRLTVISQADNDQAGRTRWLCQCECGKQKTVLTLNLVHGNTKSCGCLRTERKAKKKA